MNKTTSVLNVLNVFFNFWQFAQNDLAHTQSSRTLYIIYNIINIY